MDEFLKAMEIFRKYVKGDWARPFHCERDTLYI